MQYKITTLIVSSIFALGACSSSSDDPASDDDAGTKIKSHLESVGSLDGTNRIGWLLAFEDTEEQSFGIFGTFFEVDAEELLSNPVTEILSTQGDTCTVEVFSLETPLLEDQLLNDYTSVSAGEVLTLTSAAGSYSEMERLEMQGGIAYLNMDGHTYPSPDTFDASVPGDVFSAASVSVAKPSAVEGLNFTEAQVVPVDSVIQWTASESNNTLVNVTFDSDDDVYVSCLLMDDGEFTIPSSVFAEAYTVVGAETQLTFDGASRTRTAATRVDGDLFIAVSTVY